MHDCDLPDGYQFLKKFSWMEYALNTDQTLYGSNAFKSALQNY